MSIKKDDDQKEGHNLHPLLCRLSTEKAFQDKKMLLPFLKKILIILVSMFSVNVQNLNKLVIQIRDFRLDRYTILRSA